VRKRRSTPVWQHTDSRKPEIFHRFRVQGSIVEYKTGVRPSPPCKPTPRGVVDGFSNAARLRLLKFVAGIDWSTIPTSIFITLTYPDEVIERTYRKRRTDRYLFMRKLESAIGRKVCGIWRIEWVPRRSGKLKGLILPHYHILLFGVTFIHYREINRWWKDVIHHTGYVRTEVKKAGSAKQTAFYVSKYMSKTTSRASLVNASYLNNPGRHYGYHRGNLIPQCPEEWIDNPTLDQVQQLLAYANDMLPWLNKQHQSSYTLLGKYADHVKQILAMWGLTKPVEA